MMSDVLEFVHFYLLLVFKANFKIVFDTSFVDSFGTISERRFEFVCVSK